jgi:cell shape-determining protein MreC
LQYRAYDTENHKEYRANFEQLENGQDIPCEFAEDTIRAIKRRMEEQEKERALKAELLAKKKKKRKRVRGVRVE